MQKRIESARERELEAIKLRAKIYAGTMFLSSESWQVLRANN